MNGAELALAQWLADEELARQRAIVRARRYYEGAQDSFLSPRLRKFLNVKMGDQFNLNICRLVIESVAERLIFRGMMSDEPSEATAEGKEPERPVASWSERVFAANNLGVLSADVHEMALRDGEAFLIIDWDQAGRRPRMIPHPAYTSPDLGDGEERGDGFGCKAHYPDGDTSQPLLYVSKRWTEYLGKGEARQRMTLYYPDRIEKYELVGEAPKQFRDAGDETWPLPSVGRCNVVHFRNTNDLRPEHTDALPVQNAINKVMADLLGAADSTAFQIFIALGWIPTSDGRPVASDGSNIPHIEPAMMLGTEKSRQDADFKAIEGGNLDPLLKLLTTLLSGVAVVSSTPESRLSFTRQIAAEGTLKEQNEGLFAKVRKRQDLFDPAWSEAFEVARLLQNEYGAGEIDADVTLTASWEPIQARDTQDERDEWRAKKELGVPLEQLWSEMGYSTSDIERMKRMPEYQARVAMLGADMSLGGAEGG
ncbi:MAG: phage portal protein [Candidatus Promineofilum sp.]|uniref:phage portal protein n=1 Tax=Promineifilum sp. TaxID=2664178 RepID=UPI002411A1B0|nr:phage portal protein [Promineifilum sp.]